MKLFLVVCAVLAVCHAELSQHEWHFFKLRHGKRYASPQEEAMRMKIYSENKEMIAKHNERYARGEVSYSMAMNHYGDLHHHEFVRMVNGFNSTLARQMRHTGRQYVSPANVRTPDSIDWRQTGAVTGVKNQGQCGSCWAFSATGAIEGQHFRTTGKTVSLSEQNLMDCSSQYGNAGCNGGLMSSAFEYVVDNKGIDTEDSYPYEAWTGSCRYDAAYSGASISSYTDIQSGDEKQLAEAVGNYGPVSVAMDAGLSSFQFYSSGIYYDQSCSSSQLDHGVLAVGYGKTNDGHDYWIVKNSWGTSWGESGYFYLYRNMNNQCGVATMASFPQ